MKIKRFINIPLILLLVFVLMVAGVVYRFFHWGKLVDPNQIADGRVTADALDLFLPLMDENGNSVATRSLGSTIVCFGNAPFADDRGTEDNLANIIAAKTGSTVYNCSIGHSHLTAKYSTIDPEVFPYDTYNFYWLTQLSAKADVYKRCAEAEEVLGDAAPPEARQVYDTLWNLDFEDVDVIVIMYDASDYLDGFAMYNDENPTDIECFTGNLEAGIEMFQTNYPWIRIIVMSPTYAFAVNEKGEYVSSDKYTYGWDVLSTYVIKEYQSCFNRSVTFIDHLYGTINEDNARDYVASIRRHPCIGLYCGRNEGNPPALLGTRLSKAVRELHPGILYIPNSAENGVSGHGPYRAVDPNSYFAIPALKFHTERGMPAMMNYSSLSKTVGEGHLWPNDDVWGQHDFTLTGAQGDAAFLEMVRTGFGEEALKDAESFSQAAQFVNYEGYRAMFEANNVARKGLLIWMSHSAWPSLAWQTYDYFFDRTWAFWGVMKACEPLHVQFNPSTMQVQVVNASCGPLDSLVVGVSVVNPKDEVVFSLSAEVSPGEDSTIDAIDCSGVPDGPCVMTLTLTDKDATVLSENVYFRNFKEGKNTGDYRPLTGKIKEFLNSNGNLQP